MGSVSVRYIVDNVDVASEFYTRYLGFEVEQRPTPGFAMLKRDNLRLLLVRGRSRHRRHSPGYRHRRLRPGSRRAARHCRAQAHPRPGTQHRGGACGPLLRLRHRVRRQPHPGSVGAHNSRLGPYTNFVNLLDMCAVAVPAGIADGSPFGVSVIAQGFDDQVAIDIAFRGALDDLDYRSRPVPGRTPCPHGARQDPPRQRRGGHRLPL